MSAEFGNGEPGSMWDILGKVLIGVMTAGILAIVSMAWTSRDVLYNIQTDLAVIKAVQTTAAAQNSELKAETSALRERVRLLELESLPRGRGT